MQWWSKWWNVARPDHYAENWDDIYLSHHHHHCHHIIAIVKYSFALRSPHFSFICLSLSIIYYHFLHKISSPPFAVFINNVINLLSNDLMTFSYTILLKIKTSNFICKYIKKINYKDKKMRILKYFLKSWHFFSIS